MLVLQPWLLISSIVAHLDCIRQQLVPGIQNWGGSRNIALSIQILSGDSHTESHSSHIRITRFSPSQNLNPIVPVLHNGQNCSTYNFAVLSIIYLVNQPVWVLQHIHPISNMLVSIQPLLTANCSLVDASESAPGRPRTRDG